MPNPNFRIEEVEPVIVWEGKAGEEPPLLDLIFPRKATVGTPTPDPDSPSRENVPGGKQRTGLYEDGREDRRGIPESP